VGVEGGREFESLSRHTGFFERSNGDTSCRADGGCSGGVGRDVVTGIDDEFGAAELTGVVG
jgi:hypothetical protein